MNDEQQALLKKADEEIASLIEDARAFIDAAIEMIEKSRASS